MKFKVLESLDRAAGIKSHGGAIMMSPGQPAFTEHDYNKIAQEGYMKNPFVYSAVSFGGDVFSDVELKLKRRTPEGEEDVEEHPAIDLMKKPNEDQGAASFKKQLYCFIRLAGKSYTHILGPDTGPNARRPQQLVNFVPSHIEPVKGGNELISHFQEQGNPRNRFDKEDIIYIKEFHPTNTANGHPAAMSAARAVDVSNAQLEWNLSVLDNMGMPPLVLKGSWNMDQANQWRDRLEREQQGKYNAGRTLTLPESVSVEKLGFNSKEMDWLEGMKAVSRIIYAVYQVPSELMNDGENKTYSNFEQAIKAMIYHNTLPSWRLVLDAWNHQLLPRWDDDLFFEVDMDSIASLQESMMEKLEKGIKGYESNLATKGEARGMAGLDDDVPDADRTILRSAFIPDDMAASEDVNEDEIIENGQDA